MYNARVCIAAALVCDVSANNADVPVIRTIGRTGIEGKLEWRSKSRTRRRQRGGHSTHRFSKLIFDSAPFFALCLPPFIRPFFLARLCPPFPTFTFTLRRRVAQTFGEKRERDERGCRLYADSISLGRSREQTAGNSRFTNDWENRQGSDRSSRASPFFSWL